jgi:hypothetical protein
MVVIFKITCLFEQSSTLVEILLWYNKYNKHIGEPVCQAEREAVSFRPTLPDPDNAGGGRK